jgi:iron donor protein CyaY
VPTSQPTETTEAAFRSLVDSVLRKLLVQADAIDSDEVEPRFSEGVLQFEFEGGASFVLSQQVPVRELWFSANRRAWHFCWDAEAQRWLERDGGEDLGALLSSLLSERLGVPVGFQT